MNVASAHLPGLSDPPAVSIITPTYNHERFLGQCMDSVLAQTFSSWEQIIIDDGSTDATAQVAQSARDPRVRYARQDNLGIERLPETYNRALALCRAPLVAILEGDDFWPPDKLAALVPAFRDLDVVLAYGWTEVVGDGRGTFPRRIPAANLEADFPRGTLTNDPPGQAALAMLHPRALTFTYPCSVVVRRTALDRIGGFQARPGLSITDHPTFLALSLEGRFHFVPRTMGYWRVHEAGATVRDMDRIMEAVYREVVRFRQAAGARAGLTEARWRAIERAWRPVRGWIAMRGARRLLVAGRWQKARAGLWRAAASAGWRTALAALAGIACSWFGLSLEWLYRMTGRAWFRSGAPGAVDIVLPRRP